METPKIDKVSLLNYALIIGLSLIAGHYVWQWGEARLRKVKHDLSVWALREKTLNPVEMYALGYLPESYSVPKQCLDLCNADVLAVLNRSHKSKKVAKR